MRIAVVQFPGSNADWDALHTARDVLGADAYYVFHKQTSLDRPDAVIIPGGFSYGDYLRCGAIARFSPITSAVESFAKGGGPVLGICNGFQILTEMGLLPGALVRNVNLRFECRRVFVRVEAEGLFTLLPKASVLELPIAHAEGRYHCDETTLARLRENQQIALRYCTAQGANAREIAGSNPNGAVDDIAGIYNAQRNVLGMMPHPERASEAILGGVDGLKIFHSLKRHLEAA